jgi:hypothetical protein
MCFDDQHFADGTPWKLRGCPPDQSRWFLGAHLYKFIDFQVFTFYLSEFELYFGCIQEHPANIQGPPRINLEAARVSKDHVWFSKIPEIMKINIWLFPVTVFCEIRRNRCGIDARSFSQPSIYIKNSLSTAQAAVMLIIWWWWSSNMNTRVGGPIINLARGGGVR